MESSQTDKELFQFLDEGRQSFQAMRYTLEREAGLCMSYYEGYGYTRLAGPTYDRLQTLRLEYNPEATGFRVAQNVTTKFVQRAAVKTQPVRIEIDCYPPDRETGQASFVRAQTVEDVANEFIDMTGMVQRWSDANFGRAVCGHYVFGWCTYPVSVPMQGMEKPVADVQMEAFAVPAVKLSVDPREENRELDKHDWVIYSDAWSWKKIQRVYGHLLAQQKVVIDPEKDLATMGDLCTFEISVNTMTYNRLYPRYRAESRTRGAMIHQVHRKVDGSYGRFVMDVVLELPGGKERFIRLTPESQDPFGGCGLPLFLLNGHRRSDSMWGIGDVKMMIDNQDRINRAQTYLERQLQQNSWMKWLVDLRTMGAEKTPNALANKFNNRVGGILTYTSGMGDAKGNAPSLIQPPQPQPMLTQLIREYEDSAREDTHQAPGNFGAIKTHTPDASFQRALDEAGQVSDMRIAEDKLLMEKAITTMVGTVAKFVQRGSPATLGLLDQIGCGPEELVVLSELDPIRPQVSIRVREASIRLQSHASRKANLDTALQYQAVDASTYRREMASLDTPLTTDDRTYMTAFSKIALEVMNGREWQPIPMGDRTPDLIEAFRKAMLDRRVLNDPEAMARLTRAVQAQQMMMAQEAAVLQGPMQAQQQPTEEDPAEAAFSDMVNQIAPQMMAGQGV